METRGRAESNFQLYLFILLQFLQNGVKCKIAIHIVLATWLPIFLGPRGKK